MVFGSAMERWSFEEVMGGSLARDDADGLPEHPAYSIARNGSKDPPLQRKRNRTQRRRGHSEHGDTSATKTSASARDEERKGRWRCKTAATKGAEIGNSKMEISEEKSWQADYFSSSGSPICMVKYRS